jgi:hypothetical protein
LILDADDRIEDASKERLATLLRGLADEPVAYLLTARSRASDGTTTEIPQARLFRNDPRIRWEFRVHEQIAPSIRAAGHTLEHSGLALVHVGYEDERVRLAKSARNLRLLQRTSAELPDHPSLALHTGATLLDLGRAEEALSELLR